MRTTRRRLTILFCAPLALCVAFVVLFEADILPCGLLAATDDTAEFVATAAVEAVTICLIPLALRLFRFAAVARSLTDTAALLRWGTLRLLMLSIPLVVNTLLYYLYMSAAFGYLAIILALCMIFVVPTRARCEAELRRDDKAEEK